MVTNDNCIRVLHIFYALNRAGAETAVMNFYRKIDRTNIQFDFLAVKNSLERYDYEDEIVALGGKIHKLKHDKGFMSYFKALYLFFKNHKEYKIIHIHITANSFIPLLAAKLQGIPIRIVHSHSINYNRNLKTRITKPFIKYLCTDYLACGKQAGEFLFGKRMFSKRGNYIKNSIDTERFKYNEVIRKRIRHDVFNIQDNQLVIGCVARFSKEKDHKFLLNVFNEVLKRRANSFLYLVGDGELKSATKNYAKSLGIESNVVFTGGVSNVNEYLQGFDIFILTSDYEGFPVTLIEAQASGLKCFASNQIPKESSVTELISYISKNESFEYWAEMIIDSIPYERKDMSSAIVSSGFDSKTTAKLIENFYISKTKAIR